MKKVFLVFWVLVLLTSAFAVPSGGLVYPDEEYLSRDVNIVFNLSKSNPVVSIVITGIFTDSSVYDSNGVVCISKNCYYDWNTLGYLDNNYWLDISVHYNDNSHESIKSDSNFIVDNTKPIISNPIPSNWINASTTELTVEINDNLADVNSEEIIFNINSGLYKPVYDYSLNKASLDLNELELLDGNTYVVKVDANDNAKNSAIQVSYTLKVDRNAPSFTTIDINSLVNSSKPIIDLNAIDTVSGIKGVKYSCDGSNWTDLINITSLPTQNNDFNIINSTYGCNTNEGDKNVFVIFIDNADNNSSPIYKTITYDSIIPTSLVSFSPTVLDYSDTNVTITCSDSYGINRIDYNLNGDFNSINSNTLTLNLTMDGNNEISYSCVDNALNNNGLNYVYVPIDKTSPSATTLTLNEVQRDTNVILTWTSVEDFSGIKQYIVYKRDSNSSPFVAIVSTTDLNYVDSNNVSDTNEQYCYFVQTIDNALRDSNSSVKCIYIDIISPLVVSLTSSVNGKDVTLNFSATDTNGSGVKGYYVSRDKNSWIYTTNTNYIYSNLANGDYTFYVKAIDNADNNSLDANILATVNYTQPSFGGGGSSSGGRVTTSTPKESLEIQTNSTLIEDTNQTITEPMLINTTEYDELVIETNNGDSNTTELNESRVTGLFGFEQLNSFIFPFLLLLILLVTLVFFIAKRRKNEGNKLYY